MNTRRLTPSIGAATFVVCLGLSSLSVAQPAAAPSLMSRVTITQVKADMINDWIDLQKNEVVPALKKAGQASRTVYASGVFGTAGEYLLITPMAKYADFDADNPLIKALGAEAAARLIEKLRKCTISSHSYVNHRLADLSNPVTPPLRGLVSTRVRVNGDKTAAFMDLVKTDVLPSYKKANASLTINRRGFGANPNDFTISAGFDKFADLDVGNTLVRQLGPEAAAKVLVKFAGLVTVIEQVVRTRVVDLSF